MLVISYLRSGLSSQAIRIVPEYQRLVVRFGRCVGQDTIVFNRLSIEQ